jgi:ATP-dependent helicase/nuclease subunit B
MDQIGPLNRLDHKLHDLALLLQDYQNWLKQHRLQDGDRWLDLATDVLRTSPRQNETGGFQKDWIEGLWLDGFAQMTPRERSLLTALTGHCRQATLAFCLEQEPAENPAWYSQWALLSQTYHQCRTSLEACPNSRIEVETLARNSEQSRFHRNKTLQHLERYWANPRPFLSQNQDELGHDISTDQLHTVRIVKCPNPEVEAILAARTILDHVRVGGRYRETAVQVRSLELYHAGIRRVFSQYEIPFFIDRREGLTHHPLAELTRNTLRVVAFGWKHDDRFGALKSGL